MGCRRLLLRSIARRRRYFFGKFGGEYGMGAEIGISTDKVGARGPMGLDELTTYKWLGYGTGQVRT